MSEQDGTQTSTKRPRNRQASKQNDLAPALQRPTNEDKETWRAYWKTLGQLWRTEPEIEAERQKYLVERRSITANIEQGIYPFKDVKLTRADIEWLLATHEEGRGPIFWSSDNNPRHMGLDLRGANLRQISLRGLPLAFMRGGLFLDAWLPATEEQRNMAAVQLQGANLRDARLQGAYLRSAQLQGARLIGAQLQGAHLRGAQLQGGDLRKSDLDGATLDRVTLSDGRYGSVRLPDVRWGSVNLTVVDWGHVTRLGDEQKAHQKKNSEGKTKDKRTRIDDYKEAVRAYRQLSVVLRNQGLNEDAARFSYRAQLMQRKVFWHQGIGSLGQYLFSLSLDLLTGYGYKPLRSFIAYAVVISVFATIYFLLGSHLAWNEAIVISMTAFHGRGFFPEQFHPGDPQALIAAIEAFVGLLIEVTFIATLTQRLFGK